MGAAPDEGGTRFQHWRQSRAVSFPLTPCPQACWAGLSHKMYRHTGTQGGSVGVPGRASSRQRPDIHSWEKRSACGGGISRRPLRKGCRERYLPWPAASPCLVQCTHRTCLLAWLHVLPCRQCEGDPRWRLGAKPVVQGISGHQDENDHLSWTGPLSGHSAPRCAAQCVPALSCSFFWVTFGLISLLLRLHESLSGPSSAMAGEHRRPASFRSACPPFPDPSQQQSDTI